VAQVSEDERVALVGRGRFRLDVEPAVYGTVVLLTVLVVALDDGVADIADAALIVLGPLIATFAAHLFASVLASVSAERRPPTRARLAALTGHAAQFLLLAPAPLIVVAVVGLTGLGDPDDAVGLVVDLGLAVLVVLGGVGGWRALHRWWAVLAGAVGAGVLGCVVLVLRLVLEH
jgi:hypothetical protein